MSTGVGSRLIAQLLQQVEWLKLERARLQAGKTLVGAAIVPDHKLQAAIFDVDGTLVDTMPGFFPSWVEAGEKQPVAILGGTGLVGRALAAALTEHPIYSLGPVLGSPQTVGSKLADVWRKKEQALEDHYGSAIWQAKPCPPSLDGVKVSSVEDLLRSNVKYVISAIAPSLGHIEDALQEAGIAVFSISPHARQVQRNPLVVPEVNGDALLHALSKSVEDDDETIPLVKSPNCVSCGVSVVLKALDDAYGVVGVSITTFQALSGRGDAKYDPELVVGNVYPLRNTVERTDEYQRRELMRIFPLLKRCAVSAHRVPVQNGHFVDLKLQTKRPVTTKDEVKKILRDFAPLAGLGLPSMPDRPIVVLDEVGRPRPKAGRHGGGQRWRWHSLGPAPQPGIVAHPNARRCLSL